MKLSFKPNDRMWAKLFQSRKSSPGNPQRRGFVHFYLRFTSFFFSALSSYSIQVKKPAQRSTMNCGRKCSRNEQRRRRKSRILTRSHSSIWILTLKSLVSRNCSNIVFMTRACLPEKIKCSVVLMQICLDKFWEWCSRTWLDQRGDTGPIFTTKMMRAKWVILWESRITRKSRCLIDLALNRKWGWKRQRTNKAHAEYQLRKTLLEKDELKRWEYNDWDLEQEIAAFGHRIQCEMDQYEFSQLVNADFNREYIIAVLKKIVDQVFVLQNCFNYPLWRLRRSA